MKKSAFQGFSAVREAFFQRQRKQIFQALKKTPLKKILQKQSLAKGIFFLFQSFLFQRGGLFFPNPFQQEQDAGGCLQSNKALLFFRAASAILLRKGVLPECLFLFRFQKAPLFNVLSFQCSVRKTPRIFISLSARTMFPFAKSSRTRKKSANSKKTILSKEYCCTCKIFLFSRCFLRKALNPEESFFAGM